ncbi:hypothetical protein SNE26_23945 [Mucilaginibacter sp. cycad4]|uniref:TrlF family AAA-like ATPase n=1 Tax=Mucilaginibacter sp. cycad4 TaxID=3342096 RepID=UPI002AAC3FC0|nr:hypothetical protein [Mucilaginibacter gossypii]WPU99069.1 hypothetical protein SNE26_23945 [Mucilaginibacter gossypii]
MSANNRKFPKGSEWRKWDLHVHTPYSLVEGFTGTTIDEKWENFIKDLEDLPEEFQVIGINDYLFIDGYKKILEYRRAGRLKNIQTILPVVEFRVKKFAGHKDFKRINFHVIFSDELTPEIIESQFLNSLTSKYHLTPGINGIRWNGVVTKESLEDLGAAIKQSVSPEQLAKYGSDLQEGFNNLNLDEEDIFKVLKENTYLKGKSLTAIGKTEWESLSWSDQSIAEKKDVINKVDLVFISSETVEACHNAKKKLTEQLVNNLLLDCSDAHYNSTNISIKDRIGKCFTWIKADPTFNGLKQIVHEPDTRIIIRDIRPDTKTDYNVLDKVRFVGVKDDFFGNDVIELNPNLNVIIGGKSSGKSLLLFHTAKTVDPVQVKEKLGIVGEKEYDLKSRLSDFDFEVHWKDGHIDLLSADPDTRTRQITYVPQMYINHLAEQKGEKKLGELIESILLQNPNFKTFYEDKTEIIQNLNLEIANDINEIFIIKENYQQAHKEHKAIGDKTAITSNIASIQKDISDLKSKSGFSDIEVKQYERLVKRKQISGNNLERLNNYLGTVDDYLETIVQLKTDANDTIDNFAINEADFDGDISATKFVSTNKELDKKTSEDAFKLIEAKYVSIKADIRKIINRKVEALAGIEKEFEPFNTKIKSQEQLKTLNQRMEQDQNKIKSLDEKAKQMQKIADAGKLKKEQILNNSDNVFKSYQEILNEIKKPELAKIGTDLKLDVNLEIDLPSFQNGFCSLLDGRSNFNVIFGNSFNASNEYVYEEGTHQSNLKAIYEKVWFHEKNNIKFKAGFGPKQAISQLLKDNFKFKYNILYNGDDILQMSPGKRGLVLMQIILHLSNAEHPILIDQPEDNLDNRTIYNDLNAFIKEKKIKRQIILVTHNANLVVSTDAEQVIIANQNGQDKGKTNEKYQFEYASGSLENTFKDSNQDGILNQMGIREHVCDILEGGEVAFQYRERKYGFKN